MVYTWKEINWEETLSSCGVLEPLPRRKPDMPGGRYLINAVSAFDIETSRIDLPIPPGAVQNSHSFMYVWQFQFNDFTVMGRTWEEASGLFRALAAACEKRGDTEKMPHPPRLIIWVHNLAYEWQFLQGVFEFKNDDVFFRDSRKPIYCRLFDVLEFRCSYIQTNMSLAHLTKQLGVKEKLSGQKYDYDKIRYPWTELTDYEKEYCIRDVKSLVQCMRKRMDRDGDTLQTIPYTSTGYVRRDCKKALQEKPLCYVVRDMKPGIEEYKLLREAFRGGNTHANRKYVGKILENVSSYDMTSCYPAQQLTKKFPMRPFTFLKSDLSPERIKKYVGLGFAVVARYVFKNLKLKQGVPIPYLSLSRCKAADFLGGIDNGRILYAGVCETVLTEIDFNIVIKQYEFSDLKITQAMIAKKDFLPEPYRAVIQKYYELKTTLKGAKGEEEEYLYHKSKEKLNAVYGMSCQDPIHSEILYDGGEYTRVNLYDIPNKADEALRKAHFPYQWGVYVTAYARAALQDAIDIAGNKMVYCDTDSVKVVGEIDLKALNDYREKKARIAGAYAEDRKEIPHYMGVFEYEGTYDRFITQGAKRYSYEMGGKMSITVSGVSKKINEETGVPFAVEELKKLERFKEGFIWRRSAGTMSVYNDHDDFDYSAPGGVVHISPNVAILPTTYEMSITRDYRALLEDVMLYGEYIDRRS